MEKMGLTDSELSGFARVLAADTVRNIFPIVDPVDVASASEQIRIAGINGIEIFRREVRVARGFPPDEEDFVPRRIK